MVPWSASHSLAAERSSGVKHGPQVEGRAADDLEHFRGGCLLLQGLGEIGRPLPQFVKEPRVLDGNHRLRSEVLHQLDLLVGEGPNLLTIDPYNVVLEHPQRRGNEFYRTVTYGYSPAFLDYIKDLPVEPARSTGLGRALLEGKVIHIADVEADPDYTWKEAQQLGGFHTMLGVPMLREGVPVGVMGLTRKDVRPFTDKQIELVTTFADQAAIAIKNVQLFDEIQDKSRQLEEASQHKSQFLANMSHELRTPLNAILGYTELMADGAYGEPSEKMLGILKRLESNGKHLLGLINDVLDLSKIEAGQLVLELSDYSLQDIAQTVRSTLEPLAADKKLAFKVEMPSELPPGHGDGRRLTQVLINLVGNAIKFTDAGEIARSKPRRTMAHSMSRSVTPVLVSPLPIRPGYFRSSSRPTMPSRARRAAPAWGSPYRSASSRCTGAGSGSSHSLGKAPHLLSLSR